MGKEALCESLSSLFRVAAETGTVPGVAVCRDAPSISHLLFADDTMIFCPALLDTVHHVLHILDIYRFALGQEINLHKSSAVFSSNTPLEVQQRLSEALGIRLDNKHEIYLGLPTLAFRSKRAPFATLKDRIWRRVQGWHEKTLSQARKAILIQTVIQATPTYAMLCFRLPISLLKEIQSMAANFFRHDGDRRRIHWLSWKKKCFSKLDGGLGFRNLEAFNLALLAKQLWRILTRPDSLVSKVLKAKYFPRSHLFDASVGVSPSFTWRSLMAAKELFRAGCRWRVGIGRSVLIWQDPWLPRSPSFRAGIPNKAKVFLWQALRDILPLGHNLQKHFLLEASVCPLCGLEIENAIHTFLRCSFTRQVWALSGLRWHMLDSSHQSFESWFQALSLKLPPSEFNLVAMICWTIWWSRNLKAANKEFLLPLQVVEFARSYLFAFMGQSQVQINFDGSARPGAQSLGIGVIARDTMGHCLAWLSKTLDKIGTAEMAEAFATREALQFAIRKQWQRWVLEGDFSSLLAKLSVDNQDFSDIRPLVLDIRALSLHFESIFCSFVLRSGNSAADFLARRALNLEGDASSLPPGLNDVLHSDLAK
ncbi:UNVERIFIED_CONTAM: putative mitochondrial protein [Sesamum radiatum]|uniref:Mitochondrial protein n=1 Tax=Sesamum radiatum TaxID=300843 RepID=A0AAW2VS92_SESRA